MRPSTPKAIAERKQFREIKDARMGFVFHPSRHRRAGIFWVWLDDFVEMVEHPMNAKTEYLLGLEPFSAMAESEIFNMED